ncbi:hypothetical protein MP228_005688 [Amoeboaphelidium protococcarum]|nr:hypothetical protein MP228_005688 [Amoeboaphelidium protococcarum]
MLAVDRAFGFGQIQTRPGLPGINGKDVNAMIIRTIIQLPGADYKVLRFPLKRQYMLCKIDIVEWIFSLDDRIKQEFGEEYADIQTRCDASGALKAANALSELNRQFGDSVLISSVHDMEQYLIQGASIDFENGFALRRACQRNSTPKIRMLLQYGANVNVWSPEPIAQHANLQNFQILVQYGLDLYQYGDAGLIGASLFAQQFPVVEYLIESHRDVLSQQGFDSALVQAALNCNMEIFEFLKQHGAKEGIGCNTALITKPQSGRYLQVAYLISFIRFPPATVLEAIKVTRDYNIRQMLFQYLKNHYPVRSDLGITAE